MRLAALIASLAIAAALPASAAAQDTDRYTLERSGDGYVRMDRRTGEMSICSERTGQLVCKLAADERSAFQDEVDRLQERLTGLEKRVAELETVQRIDPQAMLPTDEQFEKIARLHGALLPALHGHRARFRQGLAARDAAERAAEDLKRRCSLIAVSSLEWRRARV